MRYSNGIKPVLVVLVTWMTLLPMSGNPVAAALRDIDGVVTIAHAPTDCSLEQSLVYIPGRSFIAKLDHTGQFKLSGVPVSKAPYTLRIEVPGATQKFFDRPVTVVSKPKIQIGIPADPVCPQRAVCGDGEKTGPEACDDGNTSNGDGCSSACAVETGFECTGQPSVCASVCGDGSVAASESCDDGNTANGDGCSSACTVETGFMCLGQPSVCSSICGDGILGAAESCDDANTANGDGCSSQCAVESGFACSGHPSVCGAVCGDGLVKGMEQCDDGNQINTDACSNTCTLNP